MDTRNQFDTKQMTYSSNKWHDKTQPICKTTIYWATKHALKTKNKLSQLQIGQKEKKNGKHLEKTTHSILGQPKNPLIQTFRAEDQHHDVKLQNTYYYYHVPYAQQWPSHGLCAIKRGRKHWEHIGGLNYKMAQLSQR